MPRGPAISLGGGLDLVSPASQARPGTLAECLNYEVAQRNGYSRIDGFVRYDGRPGVAEYRVLRLFISNASIRPEQRARIDLIEPDDFGPMTRTMTADERRRRAWAYETWLKWLRARELGKTIAGLRPWHDYDPIFIDERVQRWINPGVRCAGD